MSTGKWKRRKLIRESLRGDDFILTEDFCAVDWQVECNMRWSCGGGLDAGVVNRHMEVQIE